MWKKWFFVMVLGILPLTSANGVHARELVGQSFGGKGWNQADPKLGGQPSGGKGLNQADPKLGGQPSGGKGENQAEPAAPLLLPVSFAGVSRGSISFDLQRTGDIPEPATESVLALVGPSGDRVMRLRLSWTAEGGQGKPKLFFLGASASGPDGLNSYGIGLWGPFIEFDQPVALGAWVHVDLTWDDEARSYVVYVDGRAQVRQSGKNQPPSPEELEMINRRLLQQGRPMVMDSRPLSAIFSGVVSVRLGGAELAAPTPHSLLPGARGPRPPYLRNALLENFAVHVDEIPPPGGTLAIASVEHNAVLVASFSGKLVAGNSLGVTMAGAPGATGTFDIVHYPDLGGKITLDWRGWGVYLEEKVFYEPGEVNLRDVEGYKVYASTAPFDPAAPGMEPLAELEVGVQSYTFELLQVDTPYYLAAVARMRDGTTRTVLAPIARQPLTETEPGVYTGSYQAGWQDRYPRAVVVGRLERGGAAATLTDTTALAIDPGLTIAVAADPSELKADAVSKSKVTVTVTDANGNAVSGHKVKFLLATTSQYTGVVGGGDFADQVGGRITEDRWLETDLFGRVEMTYVAGFAAKTAIIVARDMLSNSTGSGWIKTYINATAQLELEPVLEAAAMDAGYAIAVTSSDEWLTADGKSQARITARVTLGGQPVEGHKVDFSVSSGAGSIRTVKDTTDKNGEARAVYTAGKKIGIVLITATDTTVGISGTVSIELRSDAPAKIVIKLDPERLPADGRSRAELSVLVTDINDNPNDNTEVEYAISSGGGSLQHDRGLTDKNGESATRYTAGSSAGTVTFEITVRSTVPTEAELAKARDLAVAVMDLRFF